MNGTWTAFSRTMSACVVNAILVLGISGTADAQIFGFNLDFDACESPLELGAGSLQIEIDEDTVVENPVGPFTQYTGFSGTVQVPGGAPFTPTFFGMLIETTGVDAIRIQTASGDPADPDFLLGIDIVMPAGTLDDQSVPDPGSIPDLLSQALSKDVFYSQSTGVLRPTCTGTVTGGGDPDPGNESDCSNFEADRKIKVSKEVVVRGNLFANDSIKLNGDDIQIHGSLEAGEEIGLGGANLVTGSVKASEVKLGATLIGGPVIFAKGREVVMPETPIALPEDADVKVGKEEQLGLAPGNYGNVRVKTGGTLVLSAGHYNLSKLTLAKGATISIDATGGSVSVFIAKKFVMAKDAQVIGATPSDFEVGLAGTGAAVLAKAASFTGVIIAPESAVKVNKEASVEGAICAKDIIIGKEATMTATSFNDGCDITSLSLDDPPSCNGDGTHDVCLLVSGVNLAVPPPGLKVVIDGVTYTPEPATASGANRQICIDGINPTEDQPNVFIQWEPGCTFYVQSLYEAPNCPS